MRLIALSIFLLGTITGTAQKRKPLSLPEAIRIVSPSVVAIQCVFDHLPEQTRQVLPAPFYRWVCGSGFIVNDQGYVISALHVVKGFESTTTVSVQQGQQIIQFPLGKGRLVAGLPVHIDTKNIQMRESTSDIQINVVDRDEEHDIALFKMTQSPHYTEPSLL